MRLFAIILLVSLSGCISTNGQRKVATAEHTSADGFFCPARGTTQVSIDEAYSAMENGSVWNMGTEATFSEPPKDQLNTFLYGEITDPEYQAKRGAFLLTTAHFSQPCYRQIHLEKSTGTDTNVWMGKVYVEICWTDKQGITSFTPKAGVLEYANSAKNRTKQEIYELWFEAGQQCSMQIRVAPMDLEENRRIGVSSSYTFNRSK